MLFLIFIVTASASATPLKKFTRFQATGQLGYASLGLSTGRYSDPSMTFGGSYYVISKLSFGAHYFLTPGPTGSSNMNGFGMSGKYYFYNTEASFTLEDKDKIIKSFDRYFAYGGFNFLDRDVRTSRLTISYSGFGLSVGAGKKINYYSSIGIELLAAQLKSPAGSADNDANFTNLSVFYSYLF
jgi:hypothetical protein